MAVAAEDHEVGADVGGVRQDGGLHVGAADGKALNLDGDGVARQVARYIGAGDLAALVALAGDDQDFHVLGAREERQRVADGARRRPAAVPASYHAVEHEALLLDMRHDDHRSAGAKQCAFDQQFLRSAALALCLADDSEVEAPRDTAEQIGGAGNAGIKDAGFGGYPGLFDCRLETGDRCPGALSVLLALDFDQICGDAAEHAARNDRLVDEADADDMRIERGSDRDRIVGSEILRLSARQVDNDVLDHGENLRVGPVTFARRLTTASPMTGRTIGCRDYFFLPSASSCLK